MLKIVPNCAFSSRIRPNYNFSSDTRKLIIQQFRFRLHERNAHEVDGRPELCHWASSGRLRQNQEPGWRKIWRTKFKFRSNIAEIVFKTMKITTISPLFFFVQLDAQAGDMTKAIEEANAVGEKKRETKQIFDARMAKFMPKWCVSIKILKFHPKINNYRFDLFFLENGWRNISWISKFSNTPQVYEMPKKYQNRFKISNNLKLRNRKISLKNVVFHFQRNVIQNRIEEFFFQKSRVRSRSSRLPTPASSTTSSPPRTISR